MENKFGQIEGTKDKTNAKQSTEKLLSKSKQNKKSYAVCVHGVRSAHPMEMS